MSSPELYNWALIRTRYEAGETPGQISRSMDRKPSKQRIYQKAEAENWVKPAKLDEIRERLPVKADIWESLDPKKQMVVEAFALGATTIEDAALRAGVSESTVHRWKHDATFGRLCQSARAQARDDLVRNIQRFGEKEWRPSAWLLEKLWKQEFGQNQQVVQGNTFNILGSIKLGIERSEPEVIDVTPEP